MEEEANNGGGMSFCDNCNRFVEINPTCSLCHEIISSENQIPFSDKQSSNFLLKLLNESIPNQLYNSLGQKYPEQFPESDLAVESLIGSEVTEELLKSDDSVCVICLEEFELGKEVKRTPCNHVYHGECIVPWVSEHGSCPMCRYRVCMEEGEEEDRYKLMWMMITMMMMM